MRRLPWPGGLSMIWTESELWARSGALELTGRRDGPALRCAGSPASAVQAALAQLAELGVPDLPDIGLLSARARLAGYQRSAPFSAGGGCRLLPTVDGWFAISLSRDADLELLPALVEHAVGDHWEAVAQWLSEHSSHEAATRTALLGLPAVAVPLQPLTARRSGVVTHLGRPRVVRAQPVVVDLTALWAGPLCAHVLGLAGARVVKVESRTRPDGARAQPAFFEQFHRGHKFVSLDFASERDRLDELISSADMVLEGSRPRALQQLGIDARQHVERGAIWVSITAYGRDGADGMRVGFGDDVAAGAGLVGWHDGIPHPAGDALADPLAGITAAAAATAALLEPHAALLDVSMHDIAVAAAAN
jgi:hypothetical protein